MRHEAKADTAGNPPRFSTPCSLFGGLVYQCRRTVGENFGL
ncbi:protein of unknown function [Ruminococcaceae bacterium BL-4]|nr:protein of unknown function [Ruminococcaceae bacterium BL-4]